jgi:hypothetical protein
VDEHTITALLESEGRVPPSHRALAARVAAGSVAAAKAFDFEAFSHRRQPWLDFLSALCPRTRPGASPDWGLLFNATKALAGSRDEFETTLKVGYVLLRDLAQITIFGPDAPLVNLDLRPRLRAWGQALGLQGIERLRKALHQAYRLQTRNINQQLGLEVLALDLWENTAADQVQETAPGP